MLNIKLTIEKKPYFTKFRFGFGLNHSPSFVINPIRSAVYVKNNINPKRFYKLGYIDFVPSILR